MNHRLTWVVLTQGDRADELRRAVESIRADDDASDVIVVHNGTAADPIPVAGETVVQSPVNLGVPGGRHLGVDASDHEIVAFLDDDAFLRSPGSARSIIAEFDRAPDVGAVALRIEDESGTVSRRHAPRIGRGRPEEGGRVVNFLGGACAIRRSAYVAAGGYWPDLFYAHEELDLAWRLHEAGFGVTYLPTVVVEHPHAPISRHADGWRLTGRNRVLVARRNLPWPIAIAHVTCWLLLGIRRTPDRACRRAYTAGWRSGWRQEVARRPISWSTVWRLTRLGRPPIV